MDTTNNLVVTYDHETGEIVEREMTVEEQNAQPTSTPPEPEPMPDDSPEGGV